MGLRYLAFWITTSIAAVAVILSWTAVVRGQPAPCPAVNAWNSVAVVPLLGGVPIPGATPSNVDPALSWGPNVFQPVFYGYADYNPSVGAPVNLRVYYPSLDGSPQCARFLGGPGHFPLVVFLHGQCSEMDHYTKWSRLPSALARSGFIVAIPDLSGIGITALPWDLSNTYYATVNNIIAWMRSGWAHSQFVMEPPTLGIVGHSYGALLGGQLALTIPATAYVSLGGVWTEWSPIAPGPLSVLTVPKLLAWGTSEFAAVLPDATWNALPSPKHRLVFTDGEHWDYVPPSVTNCDTVVGPCDLIDDLAADFTAVFLSKHMPPEEAPLPRFTDDNLAPPVVTLTPEQMFYAGGHLTSFDAIGSRSGCSATLTWTTPDGTGTRSLP